MLGRCFPCTVSLLVMGHSSSSRVKDKALRSWGKKRAKGKAPRSLKPKHVRHKSRCCESSSSSNSHPLVLLDRNRSLENFWGMSLSGPVIRVHPQASSLFLGDSIVPGPSKASSKAAGDSTSDRNPGDRAGSPGREREGGLFHFFSCSQEEWRGLCNS